MDVEITFTPTVQQYHLTPNGTTHRAREAAQGVASAGVLLSLQAGSVEEGIHSYCSRQGGNETLQRPDSTRT